MNEMTINTRIAEFKAALQDTVNGIVRASEIYVVALDDNPRNADVFRDACADYVPAAAWSKFEAVGRKWLHPRMIMGGMADGKKTTMIKRLPYSMQERVFNRELFPLLTANGDTLQVCMLEATPEQVEQLCDGSAIRTLSAQKAWLEARSTATRAEPVENDALHRDGRPGDVSARVLADPCRVAAVADGDVMPNYGTILCADCGAEVLRTGSNQKRCVECRKAYDRARRQTPEYKAYDRARKQSPEYKARHRWRRQKQAAARQFFTALAMANAVSKIQEA